MSKEEYIEESKEMNRKVEAGEITEEEWALWNSYTTPIRREVIYDDFRETVRLMGLKCARDKFKTLLGTSLTTKMSIRYLKDKTNKF